MNRLMRVRLQTNSKFPGEREERAGIWNFLFVTDSVEEY